MRSGQGLTDMDDKRKTASETGRCRRSAATCLCLIGMSAGSEVGHIGCKGVWNHARHQCLTSMEPGAGVEPATY